MVAVNGIPPEQLNPYIYFDCEIQAYQRLETALEGHIPKMKLNYSITPQQEIELLGSWMKSYQPGRYRRRVGKSANELPLKAILMEYVDGRRLTQEALLSSQSMKSELLQAVSKMHECGVLWGDMKWRNIIVPSQSNLSGSTELPPMQENSEERAKDREALVILDFSNARFLLLNESGTQSVVASGMLSPEEWEYRRQLELKIVQNMINNGRLTDRLDEVFSE